MPKLEQETSFRSQLSFWEAIALSIGIMAPTAAMALNGALAAGITGSAVPLAFLLATVAVGLTSFAFIQFSRYFAHSGSSYAFNGIALGPRAGFFSGWALLGTYLAFTAASIAEVGSFFQALLADFQMQAGWLPFAVIAGVCIWLLAYNDITLSTRLTLVLEGLSVFLILIIAGAILFKGGASGHLTLVPFIPDGAQLSLVGSAAVFGFLSFAGFEGAATLAEETRNPRRTIPIAMLTAVVGTGLFYTLVTYAQTVGFGTDAAGIKAFAASTAPLGELGQHYLGGVMATLINAGAVVSAFASALGTATAGARLLFSLGRDGFISERLGTTSRRTGSPYLALAVIMVIAFAVVLVWSTAPEINGATLFGYLGSIGVFLILVAYILTNVGALRFFMVRRLWSWQWCIPVAALLVLLYTLYSNIYPVPAPPNNLFPYVALVWLLIGLGIIIASPALARRIGKSLEEQEGFSKAREAREAASGEAETNAAEAANTTQVATRAGVVEERQPEAKTRKPQSAADEAATQGAADADEASADAAGDSESES
ncbi:APC family permease [Ktedonosporobacter rubrisoli]|uniref:APC family permease n=1 Tax=Ktedonosporobacter rubrisoli TaxID=2509675 RepID=A0A4P6JYE5_KTERU|nr:APC family permease [Ktedonosporobacter rubrisoli]QBD80747.1 APC family permease [Ktedonosporobacter rubrisoli]